MAEMFRWGLKSAASAVDSARERGLSIELVRELWLECSGHQDLQRWEPRQLANWLSGKTDAPFDHEEALRRIDERQRATDWQHPNNVDSIRFAVQTSGRVQKAEAWITAGITFRKLTAAGLERFASDHEREAGQRLDEIDRARERSGPEAEKRVSDVDAHSVRDADSTSSRPSR